ncbi:MAG: hypothetical protein R3B90_19545 [Planctomycetaceae bacterium]
MLSAVTYIYAPNIPFFLMLHFMVLRLVLPLFNAWMYFATNEATTSKSTIGKETFGLIVQRVDGGKELTLGQASLRHLGRVLCDIPLSLPYLWCRVP